MNIPENNRFYGYGDITSHFYHLYENDFKRLLLSLYKMKKNIIFNNNTSMLEIIRYIKIDTMLGLKDCKQFYDFINIFIDIKKDDELTDIIEQIYKIEL